MSKDSVLPPEPKPLGRTNSGSAIVFDPVAQRITTAKVSRLESTNLCYLSVYLANLTRPQTHKDRSQMVQLC